MPAYDNVKIRADWEDRGVGRGAGDVSDRMDRMHDAADRANGAQERMAQRGQRVNSVFGQMGPILAGAISLELGRRALAVALDLAKLADQAEITEKTFDALAIRAGTDGPRELEKLQDSIGGTLSDLALMQKVGAGVDAGLTFAQSRTALEFLRRYSLAYGKDFQQLTATIFTGLQRGSTLMLDDAGIIIDASDSIFNGLGEVEKKAALVGRAIELMSEKMELLPEIEENVITKTDRLSASWEKFNTEIGKGLRDDAEQGLDLLSATLDLLTKIVEKYREEEALIKKRAAARDPKVLSRIFDAGFFTDRDIG